DFHFSLAPNGREDLPKVAQFLEIDTDDKLRPREELRKYLRSAMRERFPGELAAMPEAARLDQLIAEVGRQRREADLPEPYRILPNLPLSVYISTNHDNLLEAALAAEETDPLARSIRARYPLPREGVTSPDPLQPRRDPQRVLRRWKEGVDWPESVYQRESDY